jgi:hypothetical protein
MVAGAETPQHRTLEPARHQRSFPAAVNSGHDSTIGRPGGIAAARLIAA